MTHLSGDALLEALEAADVAPAQLLQDARLVERMAWASRTWLVELPGLGTCQAMVLSCGFAITTALEPELQEFIVAVPGDGVPSDTWVPLDDGSGAASVEIGVRFFVLPGAPRARFTNQCRRPCRRECSMAMLRCGLPIPRCWRRSPKDSRTLWSRTC